MWTPDQEKAFQELKTRMCTGPILRQPDFNKRFFIQTDASNHGIGAVLSQEGRKEEADIALSKGTMPKLHLIAYYSATFTLTQQKYDIYEKELLAVVKSLEHWRAYLGWGKHQFTVLTNHANLTFWKHPRKLNNQIVCWHAKLQDYDFKILHIKGKVNSAADALSRADDMEKCKERKPTVVIPSESFLNSILFEAGATTIRIQESQQRLLAQDRGTQAKPTYNVVMDPDGGLTIRKEGTNEAIIPSDESLKHYLLEVHYDHPTARHLGRDETLKELKCYYYWLLMSKWVEHMSRWIVTISFRSIWRYAHGR